ncbi:MAG: hypothetical protein K2X47_11210, partial [Bdellovibrionales bacterium]|nr:hypothetical protein [Bdellovibrionales bacterium]
AITQVGLIFCEIAAGLHTFALLHLAANATLRCYQLLVSPSVVAALLREQSSLKAPKKLNDFSIEVLLPMRLRSSLYAMAISQAYTDQVFDRLVFHPLRKLSKKLHLFSESLPSSTGIIVAITLALPALLLLDYGPLATSIGFLIVAILTFGTAAHKDGKAFALRTWFLIGAIQIAMGITLYVEHESPVLAIAQIVSVVACLFAGANAAKTPGKRSSEVLFFCATLMMVGYPVGIPFIAEDILVHHFVTEQLFAALALGLTCSLSGWTAMRAFVSLFWESSVKENVNSIQPI